MEYETNTATNDRSPNREEFTLFVSNLPGELNAIGLLQIFNQYGEVKGHFHCPNTNWAYITYNTFLEAERAIKDLHNVPPLRLKVSFARERDKVTNTLSVKDTEQYINHNANNITVTNKPMVEARGRGNPLDVFKKVEPNPGLPRYTYTTNNDLLYPYPSDPQTYNPYENAEPYASANTLWARGQLTISQDGKRHVSLGRGYTMYEIPDPDPDVHNCISKVYEKRTNGLYQYGVDMLTNEVGSCNKCSQIAKFTCERCHTFYCSRTCQVLDWSTHKTECKDIPALVTAVHSMPVSKSNEQIPNRNVSSIQMPLRRPKRSLSAITNLNEVIHNVSKDKVISNAPPTGFNDSANDNDTTYVRVKTIEQNNPQSMHQKNEIERNTITPGHDHSSLNTTVEKKSHNSVLRSPKKLDNRENIKKRQFGIDDVEKMEENITFTKNAFLSQAKFTDVKIIVKSNREFWVQKVEDEDALTMLMRDLQLQAETAPQLKPTIGSMCAVKYETIWHRAVVTSLDPLKVHYIDYGNEEIMETNDFRAIHMCKNIPQFSVKIRLSEKAWKKHKNLTYEDVIRVKMISIDSDKTINVEVENENEASMSKVVERDSTKNTDILEVKDNVVISETPPNDKMFSLSKDDKALSISDKLKSVISTVTVGELGILEVHAELKNNTYGVTLLPNNATSDYEKLLNDLPTICERTIERSIHKPQVGELICGRRLDGDWLRGYLLSNDQTLKMAIIDEARVMAIDKTVACSEEFLNICAFGAVCEITDAKYKFKESDQCEFKVIAVNNEQGKIEIEISDTAKGIVKHWMPMPEQKGLQYAQLKSGSEVSLTAYRNHFLSFARPLDTEELEYYNDIMQTVAKFAQTSPALEEPPVVGQMVLAQYVDDNYYRAIVTKIENDKIIIAYVDFGNIEVTNMKKLKILPDNLKQFRSCTTKIILKDVPNNVPMTKEANDYLCQLVGGEIPLICTFDGVPSKDGVYLERRNGEDVNKRITELLAPVTKEIAENDKTCYMEDDLSTISLGNTGDIVEVLVLHSIEDGYKYAMCPLDHDLMTYVYEILQETMTTYCEQSDCYIPRERELCLAFYEGSWYRAICIRRSYTPTTSTVFFLDFGNTEFVEHENIRLMPKNFTSPAALASLCNIVNIAPTDSHGRYSPKIEKRISELIACASHVRIKIVESNEESRTYKVELPLVRSKLIEEGLISV
ncbi:vreteno [Xylocopa sonorina]|uniref:vreteno n=1 Tax=Xylocopa sonorina TaxID=1818115 RepID=UPI00403AF4EC